MTEAWREHLALVNRLADASGPIILRYFRQPLEVEDKAGGYDGHSPVTAADREAEAAIRALIEETFPDHGILGEEEGSIRAGARFTWVIDPIDGTKAFIAGMPTWGTLIGLTDGGRAVLGMLDQPFLGERFIGSPAGAFLGDRPLSVRRRGTLEAASLYATDPGMFDAGEREAFEALAARVAYRRYGADCYAYGMLALGCIDLVVESSMNTWDIVALIPVVEAAGGIVTSWSGGRAEAGGQVVAAGDARIHEEALRILSPAARPTPQGSGTP